MLYGHELTPQQVEGRTYTEFKPDLQQRTFTPYSVDVLDRNRSKGRAGGWVGFLLKGPGYLVSFAFPVNGSHADGSPNIYHAAVFGEEMADPETNTKLEAAFQN